MAEREKEECKCKHNECHCECDEECKCGGECDCGENCTCETHCECEECHCDEECECHNKEQEYLNLARQIQADFENYRRHAVEDKNKARIIGQISVIEAFLPCLDTFKEAKKSIA